MKPLKCPLKRPRPPRCFYTSFAHFVFGCVSPSLYLNHLLTSTDPKVIKFFQNEGKYEVDLLEWKIEKRIATRQEYKKWRRQNECKKV